MEITEAAAVAIAITSIGGIMFLGFISQSRKVLSKWSPEDSTNVVRLFINKHHEMLVARKKELSELVFALLLLDGAIMAFAVGVMLAGFSNTFLGVTLLAACGYAWLLFFVLWRNGSVFNSGLFS